MQQSQRTENAGFRKGSAMEALIDSLASFNYLTVLTKVRLARAQDAIGGDPSLLFSVWRLSVGTS